MRAIRPDTVHCSATGYGQDGPFTAQPGDAPVFQAISGIMSAPGQPESDPGSVPLRAIVPYVDVTTGMIATSTILGALFHRQRTGEGQRLCRFLGVDERGTDPRGATNAQRMERSRELDEALSARTREHGKAELAVALGMSRDAIEALRAAAVV